METSKSQTTGQILADGDTVRGSYAGGDYDFYMVKAPKETTILLVMIKTSGEKSLNSVPDYLYPFVSGSDVNRNFGVISDDYFMQLGIYEDDDGESYYIGMIAVYEDFLELGDYIGVTVASDYVMDYELFLYYITEEMAAKMG